MKLINSTFDSKVLDDRIYDKRERIRVAREVRYKGEPEILDFEQAAIARVLNAEDKVADKK